MTTSSTAVSNPISRTSAGLRDAIFDEIDAMRAGRSNATRATAIAKLSMTIVETVKVEIDAHRFSNQLEQRSPSAPSIEGNSLKPLKLGE